MSEPAATAEQAKKGGKKKLVILLLAILLLGGGGAGAWFSGLLPRLLGKNETAAADGPAKHSEDATAKPSGHVPKAEAGGHGAKPAAASAHGAKPAEAAKAEPGFPFMDLPDIVANLNGGPRRTVFVKLKAKLELSRPEDGAALQAAMPRVLDLFQGYLREMRPEELRGSAGTYRLREELLARTNLAAPPARVTSILFTELLIQ